MRSSTPNLRSLLGSDPVLYADLFTVTLRDGSTYRWTTADVDVVSRGSTWVAAGTGTAPGIEPGRARWALGLEVSTYDMTLLCGDGARIGTELLTQAAADGELHGASVLVERAVFASWDLEPEVMHWFEGTVSDCEPSSTRVRLTVKSLLGQLAVKLPKRLFSGRCPYALYDPDCGLTMPAPTTRTVASPAPFTNTASSFAISGTDAAGFWTRGTATVNGETRTVTQFLVLGLRFLSVEPPFSSAPAIGDAVLLQLGCAKTIAACTAHGNKPRFGGHPFIPSPQVAR